MKRSTCFIALFLCLFFMKGAAQNTIWKIGNADKASNEFALAPDKFKDFIGNDFGYEDKFFLVGHSKEKADFPYPSFALSSLAFFIIYHYLFCKIAKVFW